MNRGIVDRLRECILGGVWRDLLDPAADEIERLRAELAAETKARKAYADKWPALVQERDALRADLAAEREKVDNLKKACLAGIRAVSATEEAESEAIAELSDEREAHQKTHDTMNEIIIENTRLRAELAKRDELLLDCASALWPFSDWLDAKRGIGMEHFNRAADIRSRIELFVGPARGYGDE